MDDGTRAPRCTARQTHRRGVTITPLTPGGFSCARGLLGHRPRPERTGICPMTVLTTVFTAVNSASRSGRGSASLARLRAQGTNGLSGEMAMT